MFDSVVIDVAIALALIFFVFSLVVSGFRELVSRALETRSKEMWRAVRELLDDPVKSGLRELRAAADRLGGEAGKQLQAALASAETAVRGHIDSGETSEAWKSKVDAALAGVSEVAAGNKELSKLVKKATTRLTSRHGTGKRTALGVVNAARRGGDRPVAGEGAPPSVIQLGTEVASGARTLTDAIHDHPLVRQVDRTWPGFHSRLQRLENEDFSRALVDVVQAAGIEPSLKDVFTEAARVINRLEVDDAAKQQLWEPIKKGWIEANAVLGGAVPRVEQIEHVFTSLRQTVDGLIDGDGPDLGDEQREVLVGSIEAARSKVAGFVEDPTLLLRVGADLLEDSVPAKQILQRLAAEKEYAVAEVRARLGAVRDSLGDWYDGRMGALSTWYRKRSRFVGFGLGLVVAVGFNVDAVRMPQELWQDENVRGVVVALADQTGLDVSGCLDGGTAQTTSEECVEDRVDDLVETGLPVGWDWGTECDGACGGLDERLTYAAGIGAKGERAALLKVAGWLVAAGALSMGASFWYDVLRRATGIKQTVKAVKKEAAAS